MANGNVVIKVSTDIAQARKSISDLNTVIKGLGPDTEKVVNEIRKDFSRINLGKSINIEDFRANMNRLLTESRAAVEKLRSSMESAIPTQNNTADKNLLNTKKVVNSLEQANNSLAESFKNINSAMSSLNVSPELLSANKQKEFQQALNYPSTNQGKTMSSKETLDYFNTLLNAYEKDSAEYQKLLEKKKQSEAAFNAEQVESARLVEEQKRLVYEQKAKELNAVFSTTRLTAQELDMVSAAIARIREQSLSGTASEMASAQQYARKLSESINTLNNSEASLVDKETALNFIRSQLNNSTSMLSNTNRALVESTTAQGQATQQAAAAQEQASKRSAALAKANQILTKKTGLFGKMLRQVTGYLAMYLSIFKLISTIKEALNLSSDLIEIQNVVDTTFEESADSIDEFAKTAVHSFGMAEVSAKKFASSFGATLKAAGIEKNLDSMSISLTKLVGDFASFRNLDYEDAFQKITSAITGQTRGIRLYGVAVTDANLSNYALELGINKSTKAMTENEKIMLRMSFMLRAMNDSAGDFVKTQDTWANQTRLLSETWKEFLTIMGDALRIVFTGALKWIVKLMQSLVMVAKYIRGFFALLSDANTQFDKTGNIIAGKWTPPDNSDWADGTEKNLEAVTESAEETAEALNDVTASYDDVVVLAKETSSDKSKDKSAQLTEDEFNLDELMRQQQEAIDKYSTEMELPEFDVSKLQDAVAWYKEHVKPIFDWIVENSDTIKKAILGIVAAFLAFKLVQTVYTVIQNIINVISVVKLLITAIPAPVLAIVAAILAVIAVMMILYAKSEKFREHVNNVFTEIGEVIGKVVESIKKTFSGLTQTFEHHKDTLAQVFGVIVSVLAFSLKKSISLLGAAINTIIRAIDIILEVFSGLIKVLVGIFTGDWEMFLDGIVDILAGAVKIITGLIDIVIDVFNSLFDLDITPLTDQFNNFLAKTRGQKVEVELEEKKFSDAGEIEEKKFSSVSLNRNSGSKTDVIDNNTTSRYMDPGKNLDMFNAQEIELQDVDISDSSIDDMTYSIDSVLQDNMSNYGLNNNATGATQSVVVDDDTLEKLMSQSAIQIKNAIGNMPQNIATMNSNTAKYLQEIAGVQTRTLNEMSRLTNSISSASNKSIQLNLDGKLIGQTSVNWINGTTMRTGKNPLFGV